MSETPLRDDNGNPTIIESDPKPATDDEIAGARSLADEIEFLVTEWGMHAEGIRVLNEDTLWRVRALEAERDEWQSAHATLQREVDRLIDERDRLREALRAWEDWVDSVDSVDGRDFEYKRAVGLMAEALTGGDDS